ncbi:MAG: 16S rRNA (cytidine(1402)-2'-O)-methyltransferase [Caldisericaceae bacterium]|nr:16S rRNA (cytidine(1402)-2'-O)-methyltransferase [Caldisericaceae bacterium]
MENIEKGVLYMVSTPIGNLADITYRAVHILKNVGLIAAEDTRKSSILLQHYQISTPMRSYHSYNLQKETPRLIRLLKEGQSIALISDAGTPGISDPGYHLARACMEEGIRIVPIPGPAAFLTALIASGLPSHRFVFEGFLPQKKGRKTRIEQLAWEERTIVLYESPHRVLKTVGQLLEAMGDRRVVMARELTKKFEEFFHGTLSQLKNHLETKAVKGEIVLIIEGISKREKKNENK